MLNSLIFGFPLVFWFGILAFLSIMFQFYSGYKIKKGQGQYFKYHGLNNIALFIFVVCHIFLSIYRYIY